MRYFLLEEVFRVFSLYEGTVDLVSVGGLSVPG